ncbi:hypothetical protein [Variovorax sp. YR216]|uniref:hypothetical protein n=1 Tax=Variovorax sp. YR216 TaxID=1882828 RepID=UPI00089D93D4|nr:hypothetical protein [Variovorax sp. YR216]SEB19816.1 hypothetical protein SAMN05444680_1136 [Variovorax sp. YR216]
MNPIYRPGDAEFLPGLLIVNRRAAPPIEQQPHMELVQWRVLMSGDGDIHLIGFLLERPTIRLTSAVLSLCMREAITSSGRRYKLVGAPSEDEHARALIEMRAIELMPPWRDVTDFYWARQEGTDPSHSGRDPDSPLPGESDE